MNQKIRVLLAAGLSSILLAGCGEDPAAAQFQQSMDAFCTKISEIDTSINSIDAQSDNAPSELLSYLDQLDAAFQTFGSLDFPEDFNYLEEIADESSAYMTEAVANYHTAYGGGSYDEYTAAYAKQCYSRAYKRVQIIITFLHGETPDDADLTIEYQEQ